MKVFHVASTTTKVVLAFIVVTVVTPMAAAGVALATQLFVPLPAVIPEPEELENIQFSQVYDVNGDLIHTYKQFDQSIRIQPGDIPQVLKNAVIAAEDRNFYSHSGVDVRGTIRALVTDVREGELAQGGSTITQQLAKNAYGVGRERTISRKIREAVLAAQLDRSLTKDQILYEYLDIVYFGDGAYGIGAAAQVYFQKPVNNLTLSESALLAGLIPAPSRFSPRVDPGAAEIRRKQVLDAMLEENLITSEAWEQATKEVVWLEDNGPPPGPVTLVRARQREVTQYPYFIQFLTRFLTEKLGEEDVLYQGGLQIFTTLDPAKQQEAEATVAETLEGIDPHTTTAADGSQRVHQMQMSITTVDPRSGFVKAMVGGRDFSVDQTNIAIKGAGSIGRQPGSSFKPFVLATAFEQGIKPTAIYSGGYLKIGDYEPQNYGGARYGNMTLRTATHKSVNTVFVRLMQDVGPYEVVDLANDLGLEVRPIDPKVDGSGLSIALGSREVSTLGMASAYGTFGNDGIRMEPSPVVRVFDPDGELLLDYSDLDSRGTQVIRKATADNVTDVLRGVLTSGTASGRGIGRVAAGKTGTTQDNRDAWFVGYTPTLSTSVFMGWDPPPPAGVSWRVKGRSLTGGSWPARAWQRYMKVVTQGEDELDFGEPTPIPDIVDEEVRRERRGFGPGSERRISSIDAGMDLVVRSEDPEPPMPTTTTSTTTTSTSTTTTTTPDGGILFPPDEDDEDDGGS